MSAGDRNYTIARIFALWSELSPQVCRDIFLSRLTVSLSPRQARLDDRLLDLFPPHKRTLGELEAHFLVGACANPKFFALDLLVPQIVEPI